MTVKKLINEKYYIFVTGSVCSSVGKGVVNASIGVILQSMGYKVKIAKIDPYLNYDAGTMNPKEHGEVWVTKDGQETDMDIGTYFRILGEESNCNNITTGGQLFSNILKKERQGIYQGDTVRINPHLVEEIKEFIFNDEKEEYDFKLIEIGGTIGEMELDPYVETIKSLQNQEHIKIMHINVGLSIFLQQNNEIKMKPIENLFQNILPYGLKVDLQIIRGDKEIGNKEIQKVQQYSNVKNVIGLPTMESVYEIPIFLEKKNIHNIIFEYFNLPQKTQICNFDKFKKIINLQKNENSKELKVAIIGKYSSNLDSYKSIGEALMHASAQFDHKIKVELFDLLSPSEKLLSYDCLVFAGGFGINMTEEIMVHIRYARQNNIPTLLICFGLQLALIEIARNILNIKDATSLEFSDSGTHIICLVDEKHNPKVHNLGGTLRVGEFKIELTPSSQVYTEYKQQNRLFDNNIVKEKFRHRYWINKNFMEMFEKIGVIFTFNGVNSPTDLFGFELDRKIHNHKFFAGIQFHPELSSSIYTPHPLFIGLIRNSIK